MSEVFVGKGLKTQWHENDLVLLFRACVALGNKRWELLEHRAVVGLLQSQVELARPGARGFNFDTPPAELSNNDGRSFFAGLLQAVAEEISQPQVDDDLLGIGWDRDRKLHWIASLGEMYEMVRRTTPDHSVPAWHVMMSSEDEAESRLYLVLAYLDDISRNGTPPHERVKVIDGILSMLQQAGLMQQKADLALRLHQARASLETQ